MRPARASLAVRARGGRAAFVLALAGAVLAAWTLGGCRKRQPDAPPATAPADGGASHAAAPGPAAGTMPALPPLPKPTEPLPPGASCVTAQCHARLASARHVHQPVAKGACDACHAGDAGGHRYPLLRAANANCTFCHAVDTAALHRHGALDEGCTACHNPHASQTKFLLKGDSVERTCALCHDVPLKRFAHGPVAAGECTLCHQPHQSDFAGLLRGGQGKDHCLQCHQDLRDRLETATHVHQPLTQGRECATCHHPHASNQPRLLTAPLDAQCLSCHDKVASAVARAAVPHEAMTAGRSCANCHDAHASPQASLLPARMDQVCLTCHDKSVQARDGRTVPDMKPALTARHLHGPVRSGSCSQCHDSHGAAFSGLLTHQFPRSFYAPFEIGLYDLCFSCHDRQTVLVERTRNLTNFRDGSRNLHYVHVNRSPKGRTCRTCHAVHGSNLPNHMASQVPFSGSAWPLEVGFEKTARGGQCATSCHKAMGYDRSAAEPVPAPSPAGATAPAPAANRIPATQPGP